jgi:hypothetical protein
MSSTEFTADTQEDAGMITDTIVAIVMIIVGAWAGRSAARPVTQFSHIGVGLGGMVALFGVLKLGFIIFG